MANNQTEFKIKAIHEDSFWIRKIPKQFHGDLNPDLIQYNIQYTLKINEASNQVQTNSKITILYDDIDFLMDKVWPSLPKENKKDITKLLYVDYVVSFYINPLKNYLITDKDKKKLKDEILALLLDTSISMARGHIFAKTEGTIIGEHPLPYFQPHLAN